MAGLTVTVTRKMMWPSAHVVMIASRTEAMPEE